MHANIDTLLENLGDRETPALAGLEEAVWDGIRRRNAKDRIGGALGRNSSIAAVALLIGVAVGVARPVHAQKPTNIALLFTEVPPASLLE